MSLVVDVDEIIANVAPVSSRPDSWGQVRLRDVATVLNGFAFASSRFSKVRGTPLVRIRDVGRDTTSCCYDGSYDPSYLIRKGDLLVGMDGEFKAARWAGPDALLNQRVCKIDVDPSLFEPRFLDLILPAYLSAIHRNTSAQTVTHLSSKTILELPLPLAPLSEQRRIVQKVETLLARVGAARGWLERVPRLLNQFRQAALAAACKGRLTEGWKERRECSHPAASLGVRPERPDPSVLPEIPNGWRWLWLPELGALARGKSRHRPRNDPVLYGGKYPFIQTGDIAGSGGVITHHSQTYNDRGLAQSKLWPEGTVCITIAANIAETAILTYPACFPDSIVGLIANAEICIPQYVEYFLRTAKADLASFAPATAQKNINLAILNEVAVPTPPLEEQKEIAQRVQAMFSLADTIERRVAVSQIRAEKLPPSILSRAFAGELVPSEAELAGAEGRSYETAEELLNRIQVERALGAQTKSPNAGSAELRRGRKTKPLY